MTGTVTLYNSRGDFLKSRKFDSKHYPVKRILEEWSAVYGKLNPIAYYQISPDLKPETALKKAS